MDWDSTSTKCMKIPSNDSVHHVLEPHRVRCLNPSFFIWADFVIFVLTCNVADFVIIYLDWYIFKVLYHIQMYVWHVWLNAKIWEVRFLECNAIFKRVEEWIIKVTVVQGATKKFLSQKVINTQKNLYQQTQ